MRELMYVISGWLHLVATVIWIGGIAFVLMVAIPSARQVLGADAPKLMGEVSKRFTPLANVSIIILVITGIILTMSGDLFYGAAIKNKVTSILVLKHVLVLTMVAIHFYRGWILAPKIGRTSSPTKEGLQRVSLNLVKTNLGLGLIVLLLSSMLV